MNKTGRSIPRMLALDLDDTLLRSDLSISSRARTAIKRASSMGVTIVLASGRVPAAMDSYFRLLGLDRKPGYLVSNNGALIMESNTGKIIHEARIEHETILAICDLADAEGFPLQMYEDNIIYVSRQNEYSNSDQQTTGFRQVVVENFRNMAGEGCHKLIIPGDAGLIAHVETLLGTYLEDAVTIFTSRPNFLEVMPPGTDKGSALAKIAEINGISAGETMAIGDSMNDEAMIRWAGIGVAMVNGDERIKSIADIITDHTNDDDGVAEIIDKYFFDKGTAHE